MDTSDDGIAPGDYFLVKDDRTVFRCVKVEPSEGGPWVRAYEMEGPRGRRTDRMFRAVFLSKVDRILKNNEI